MYCIFDLIGEDEPKVQWRIAKENIVSDNSIILNIDVSEHNERFGYLRIDGKNRRKFSKGLFLRMSVKYAVRIMIMKAFDIKI